MAENEAGRSDDEEISRVKERIASLAEQHFETGANIYYLSQLGNELGADRPLLERLTHGKLSEFVRDQFEFEIGRTGVHSNVLYLVRPGVTSSEAQISKPLPPRYNRRFWAAFTVPLADGESRFFGLQSFTFGPDKEALKKLETEILEIQKEYVAPHNGSRSPAEIAGQIARWLNVHGLDPDQFLARHRHPSSDVDSSLLDQILNALDGEQLKRVSVPLDIIRTLGKARVR